MYSSVLALFNRSVRADVRSRGAHLARLALIGAIYLAMIQIQVSAAWVGAPGLNFFRSILWLNLTFLTLIGIGAFSNVITEEKEEDALGLLQMAGVDSLGLLLGKLGGRLIQALALLMVQYPFTLLSVTMGGVGIAQVRAAYVALAAYLTMLAGLGAFCSTVARTSRGSSGLMVLALVLYVAVPWGCRERINELSRTGQTSDFLPALQFLASVCVFLQTGDILTTGYASPVWNLQVVTNVGGGIIGFLAAWALFETCSRIPRVEPVTRGLVTHNPRRFRLFNPGRPFANALIWKDFYFATGGIAGLCLRLFCYIGLFVGLRYTMRSEDRLSEICRSFLGFQLMLLPIDASLLIARSMQDEARGQTIPSLVMLPRSIPGIVYSKLAGALIGLVPALVCMLVALVGADVVPLPPLQTTIAPIVLTVYLIPMLLLLPHLTAVIALVARWGATPLAIGAFYATQLVESMASLALLFIFQNRTQEVPMLVMGLLNAALCVACHFEMLRRFRNLADK